MFVNPIDKEARPFIPWWHFYTYRTVSVVVHWAMLAACMDSDSVVLSTTIG